MNIDNLKMKLESLRNKSPEELRKIIMEGIKLAFMTVFGLILIRKLFEVLFKILWR